MNAPTPTPLEVHRRRAHMALRAGQAATAERLLRTLAVQYPGEPGVQWLLGAALLAQGQPEASVALLTGLLERVPDFAAARVDLARATRALGQAQLARGHVQAVLKDHPHHHLAWLAYGDALVDLGQYTDALIAYERARLTDPHRARIEAATAALVADDRKGSEAAFRQVLQADPSHAAALAGLAALSLAADKPHDAERLLRHALKQSAHLPLAQRGLVQALIALGRLEEADRAARELLKVEPENDQTWLVLGAVATKLMRQEEALEAYQHAARLKPREVRLVLTLGHLNKTLGRRADSEAAYKAALQLDPASGEAWWSLADLKNYTFADEELAAMQAVLAAGRHAPGGEAQLHFALGKALEQRGRYPESFAHYRRGNALRRLEQPFDIGKYERRIGRLIQVFDAAFFAARAHGGNPDPAPIFIVGLPRSGSTLLEQVLASHSQVEGTMELPNIIHMVHEFEDTSADRDGYPEAVLRVSGPELRALGDRYLAETAPLHRDRPRFTDKLPNNFSHVGLIHAILPNASIVDARRHPLDACFSTFKQHFAEGQAFSYDLEDLGRYYRGYLALMDHWDRVLPGKVLHVQYEEVVREPERNIRRLLEHCRLPFEEACLSFHRTRRSVRTASAEQVRQPLYRSGIGYWRHFERELEPLRNALGDALERFPSYD
ncbi:MAG: sulfotransferase [Proteobacteria bacterium]|nr:sulfotransferase [Pseudomonadota bacterium]